MFCPGGWVPERKRPWLEGNVHKKVSGQGPAPWPALLAEGGGGGGRGGPRFCFCGQGKAGTGFAAMQLFFAGFSHTPQSRRKGQRDLKRDGPGLGWGATKPPGPHLSPKTKNPGLKGGCRGFLSCSFYVGVSAFRGAGNRKTARPSACFPVTPPSRVQAGTRPTLRGPGRASARGGRGGAGGFGCITPGRGGHFSAGGSLGDIRGSLTSFPDGKPGYGDGRGVCAERQKNTLDFFYTRAIRLPPPGGVVGGNQIQEPRCFYRLRNIRRFGRSLGKPKGMGAYRRNGADQRGTPGEKMGFVAAL